MGVRRQLVGVDSLLLPGRSQEPNSAIKLPYPLGHPTNPNLVSTLVLGRPLVLLDFRLKGFKVRVGGEDRKGGWVLLLLVPTLEDTF